MDSTPSPLADAVRHHQSGEFEEAGRLYKQILEVDPDHFDALHLAGLVAYQRGRLGEAVELITRAIGVNPNSADACYGLGNAALFAKHRHRWGARAWIDPHWSIWALKGPLKTPWLALTGSSPLGKRVGWYDFLSNAAQAAGRIRGGFKHRIAML